MGALLVFGIAFLAIGEPLALNLGGLADWHERESIRQTQVLKRH